MRNNEIITSMRDCFEVIAGIYPITAELIRDDVREKSAIVLAECPEDPFAGIRKGTITPKGRIYRYEDMRTKVNLIFGKHFSENMDEEQRILGERMQEALFIESTARNMSEIAGIGFRQAISLLLAKDLGVKDPLGSAGKPQVNAIIEENETEGVVSSSRKYRTQLPKEVADEIRHYVSQGADRNEQMARKIEMSERYGVNLRTIGSITAWTSNAACTPIAEEGRGGDPLGGAPSDPGTFADMTKDGIIRRCLSEFFDGRIQTPRECGIPMSDLLDMVIRWSGASISLTHIYKVYRDLQRERGEDVEHTEMEEEDEDTDAEESSSGIPQAPSRTYHFDKSGVMLMPGEVQERREYGYRK